MGVVSSKSPLERRNTVLRRSQRKSIHGSKAKVTKLQKDIKKFKGTEENVDYVGLKSRIESLERDLKIHSRSLQPQLKSIHSETLQAAEKCLQLLSDKLMENRQNQAKKALEEKKEDTKSPEEAKQADEPDYDDVFSEAADEVSEMSPRSSIRQTVDLTLVQVEPLVASPSLNKRASLIKIGVPVLPNTILEDINRKIQDITLGAEHKVTEIQNEIGKIENEIGGFVGKKSGKHYNKIMTNLNSLTNQLKSIVTQDEVIVDQVKRCLNYIASCSSFLDEQAMEDDEVKQNNGENVTANNLSPKVIRTTYI